MLVIKEQMKKAKDCIFCKIVSGHINSDIIYKDNELVAFRDANPQAPVHILVVPRKHIKNFNQAEKKIAGQLIFRAKEIAHQKGISKSGYRVVINCNRDGGQEVNHLHVHILGGRKLTGPLG